MLIDYNSLLINLSDTQEALTKPAGFCAHSPPLAGRKTRRYLLPQMIIIKCWHKTFFHFISVGKYWALFCYKKVKRILNSNSIYDEAIIYKIASNKQTIHLCFKVCTEASKKTCFIFSVSSCKHVAACVR